MNILKPNANFLCVSEQPGEVWVPGQSKQRVQDEQVMDGALEGECYGVEDQAA